MILPGRAALGAVLAMAAVAAVAGGLQLVGSPNDARLERLDNRRVSDLQQVQRAVNLSWTRTEHLPQTIDAATRDASWLEPFRDPVSQARYEYRALDASTYELCATFDRAATETGFDHNLFWSHGARRQCFTLTATDPKRPSPR